MLQPDFHRNAPTLYASTESTHGQRSQNQALGGWGPLPAPAPTQCPQCQVPVQQVVAEGECGFLESPTVP